MIEALKYIPSDQAQNPVREASYISTMVDNTHEHILLDKFDISQAQLAVGFYFYYQDFVENLKLIFQELAGSSANSESKQQVGISLYLIISKL